MTVMTRPRLGFLGVGWIGRHRMQAIADSGAAVVAAIADPAVDVPGAENVESLDALLAAGIDGIEKKMELEPVFTGDAYDTRRSAREIPKTLRAALELLDTSAMLRHAMGDAVIDHHVHTGRWEQFEYDRRITDWEIRRGFERS